MRFETCGNEFICRIQVPIWTRHRSTTAVCYNALLSFERKLLTLVCGADSFEPRTLNSTNRQLLVMPVPNVRNIWVCNKGYRRNKLTPVYLCFSVPAYKLLHTPSSFPLVTICHCGVTYLNTVRNNSVAYFRVSFKIWYNSTIKVILEKIYLLFSIFVNITASGLKIGPFFHCETFFFENERRTHTETE